MHTIGYRERRKEEADLNQIRIEGFHRLNGEVRIQGSKNAALPMMAAAVLCKGEVILHHCPDITDVHLMKEIIKGLGGKAFYKNHTMYLDCTKIERTTIPQKRSREDAFFYCVNGKSFRKKKGGLYSLAGGLCDRKTSNRSSSVCP